MEATYSSEASVDFQVTTRCYIPGDRTLHLSFSLSHLHFLLEAFFFSSSLFLLETILSSLLPLKHLALPFQVLPSPIGPLTAPVPFAMSLYMHSHSTNACFKWQTRPLVREGAPYGQDCNFQSRMNIWSWAPDGARHQDRQTDWLSVAIWLWLWLKRLFFLSVFKENIYFKAKEQKADYSHKT
jgi:hypothetical protein